MVQGQSLRKSMAIIPCPATNANSASNVDVKSANDGRSIVAQSKEYYSRARIMMTEFGAGQYMY